MMGLRTLAVFAVLAALLIAPIILRPSLPHRTAQVRLVIISPHDAQIREEFAHAFALYAAKTLNTSVDIDWRSVGGTGEITRYLDERFGESFNDTFPAQAAALAALHKPKAYAETASDLPGVEPAVRAARSAFLGSQVGSGIDLWWGGGEYPHRTYANKGFLVDAGLLRAEPGWFSDAVIPQRLSGETIYDPKGRYYGASLSVFGICASPDRLALLQPSNAPTQWRDLGDPRFFDILTIVDPTRSAASATAFERLIQQQMSLQVQALASSSSPSAPASSSSVSSALPATTVSSGQTVLLPPTAVSQAHAQSLAQSQAQAAALGRGWDQAFALIKRIGGNTRDLSDGASFAVREVIRGDVAAAMAIDFQARCEEEYAFSQGGTHRLVFTAPVGGTSVSADPISLLRGAPHHDMAVAFMRFVLSPEGQRLLDYRVGTPGGPVRTALRRMPVRKDVYSAQDRLEMSDPDLDPFALARTFTYHASWTAPYYTLISRVTRCVVMDPRPELIEAWAAIIAAGGPERVPQAWQAFCWMPFTYAEAPRMAALLERDVTVTLPLQRAWTVQAQAHYRLATDLARAGR